MPDPEHTVSEMARVARGGHLLVSVPREPVWRGVNMARGAYIKDLGNTPGPPEPLVAQGVRRVAESPREGRGDPLPVPVDDAARQGVTPSRQPLAPSPTREVVGYGAGAKILSLGIASTGVVTFAYFSVASHALNNDAQYKAIALLWSVLFVIVSVIYRPIEQLLSRTIADRRARGFDADHPLRTPMLIQAGVRAHVPGRRAGAAGADPGRPVRRQRRAVLGAGGRRAGLRGELLRARLAGRAPVVRALRRAGVHRGDGAAAVRGRGAGRDRGGERARRWWRWAWPRRRSSH